MDGETKTPILSFCVLALIKNFWCTADLVSFLKTLPTIQLLLTKTKNSLVFKNIIKAKKTNISGLKNIFTTDW